jgi:signal transduction histidine kinase
MTLKEVTWQTICETADIDHLVIWLTAIDKAFARGMEYLFTLEAEALLQDTRAELSKALIDVERLNKSKSDFIAVAAHELKTPLTLIEGYTNMLRSEIADAILSPL